MSKILLTSGCSFSECISNHIKTWPKHLFAKLQQYGFNKHISSAMKSQGNGLIARGMLYNVIEALKTYTPNDILVGVMWSGANRYDFRCTDPNDLLFVQEKIYNGWIENPTQFVKKADKNWVILNHHWDTDQSGRTNPEAKMYYKYFYDDIGSSIRSIEHILRLQLFLEKKNIKFFFTNYVDENIVKNNFKDHLEIKYLYEQINFENYLPVSSEYNWCKNNIQNKDAWINAGWNGKDWVHPTTEMHSEFVDKVICPWLKDKSFI